MNYESKAWAEAKGACLRNFNEQGDIDSVNGALALRPRIEKIVDQIWEEGFDNIYFIGIGGTYASAMQVEVYMRGPLCGHLLHRLRQHQGNGAAH